MTAYAVDYGVAEDGEMFYHHWLLTCRYQISQNFQKTLLFKAWREIDISKSIVDQVIRNCFRNDVRVYL